MVKGTDSNDVLSIPGSFLTRSKVVKNNHDDAAASSSSSSSSWTATSSASASVSSLLVSNVSLSFWGGIDPVSGIVIDQGHPLMGQSVSNNNNNGNKLSVNVANDNDQDITTTTTANSSTTTMLCLPSGRGSCTASQVLLELLLKGLAPKTIVLRDADGLVTVGALVAEEIFGVADIDIVCIGTNGFQKLLDHALLLSDKDGRDDNQQESSLYKFGGIDRATGTLVIGKTTKAVHQELKRRLTDHALPQHKDDKKKNDSDDDADADDDEHFKAVPLTKEENEMLMNSKSDAERMALRVIFRYARILMQQSQQDDDATDKQQQSSDPPSYIPVTRAHIDGCTYIGPGGLHFVERLVEAGGKVVIPTTLNSVSADRRQWQALGVPKDYAQNSIALGNAYLALNCQPSFTCAPYLLPTVTESMTPGQDVVWGESNAVVYANSVMGAHTEKTADYLDICSAITGIVPRAGVHLAENRKPRIVLDATQLFHDLSSISNDGIDLDVLAPVLGHLCGTLSNGKVSLLIGLESSKWIVDTLDKEHHLKSFCAAFGTTGTSPLIHISGITPEALDASVVEGWVAECRHDNSAIVPVTMNGLEQAFCELDRDGDRVQKIDLIALGNPHLSMPECEFLVQLVQEKTARLVSNSSSSSIRQKHDDVRLVACISRELYQQADAAGHVKVLKDFGMEFISDTCWCMLLDPPLIPVPATTTEEDDIATATLTNSGKYAHYAPGLTNRPVRFASTANCIEAAISGSYYPPPPLNSSSNSDGSLGTNMATSILPSWLARQQGSTATLQKRSLTTTCTRGSTITSPHLVFRALRRLVMRR